jgi:hypothetical protein
VETTNVNWESAQDAALDGYCCTKVEATENCVHWKREVEVGKGQKFFARSMQNILTKVPRVVSQERKVSASFKAWKDFITDKILDNIVQHTNQYILIQITAAALLMPNTQTKLR